MLKQISAKNFKSLQDISLEFTNFNLITGTNSSGKSSLLQTLLMMSQRYENDQLNGRAISLGTVSNVVNNMTGKSGEAYVQITLENNFYSSLKIEKMSLEDDKPKVTVSEDAEEIISRFSYEEDIFYLNANRQSMRDVYAKNVFHSGKLGNTGEYIMYYYYKKKNDRYLERSFDELLVNNEKYNYESLVNYWLEKLTGYKVEVVDVPDTNMIRVSFYKGELNNNTIRLRPQHVGTGVSYILEQLVVALLSKEDNLLIVENPELHLHPSAQNTLVNFYFWLSQHGRQIIIETHSDHLFNAVRVEKSQNPQDKTKKVFFFYQESDVTQVIDVEMGELGAISNMQDDLFDQFSKDLQRMIQQPNLSKETVHPSSSDDDFELSEEEFAELEKEFSDLLE